MSYRYRIGKFEVTNAQYAEFLNSVDPNGVNALDLYNTNMSTSVFGGINFASDAEIGSKYVIKLGRDKNPVVFVSWYDAARFANWLHNGQGASDTENGAYTIEGGTATPSNVLSITRNEDAKWWLPSENEWFKAGFHKNDGITGNYWSFATSSDEVPFSVVPPGDAAPTPSNTGNFFGDDRIANGFNDGYAVTGSTFFDNSQNYLTDVGAYALAVSPYGTFDQLGNAYEWNEFQSPNDLSSRGLRGGYWAVGGDLLYGLYRGGASAIAESQAIGFRVASAIPEPDTGVLLGIGILGLFQLGVQRRHQMRRYGAQRSGRWNVALAKLFFQREIGARCSRRIYLARHWRFESLEGRRMLATVNTPIDVNDPFDGLTTLREAIAATPTGGTVDFASVLNGTTITLSPTLGQLAIDKSLTIDASMLSAGLTINANDPTPTQANGDGIRAFNVTDPTNGVSPPLVTFKGSAGGKLAFKNGDPADSLGGDRYLPLSTSCQIRLSGVLRASANCWATLMLMLTFPNSIELMYVRWIPALAAKASWDKPSFSRRRRTTAPNCISTESIRQACRRTYDLSTDDLLTDDHLHTTIGTSLFEGRVNRRRRKTFSGRRRTPTTVVWHSFPGGAP